MIQPVRQVKYNKFRLSDYAFARQVREKMHNALTSYDKAGNNLFDATEIEQALIGILNENSTEVYYVVQNVFRYDRDGDQKVTYK